MVEACARLGAVEAIRAGVTVIFDHHASPGCTAGSLEIIGRVLAEAGLRSRARASRPRTATGPKACRRRWRKTSASSRRTRAGRRAACSGCTPPSPWATRPWPRRPPCSRGWAAASTSTWPRTARTRSTARPTRPAPVERLRRFGLLTPQSILAHAVHLSVQDRAAIDSSGAAVAYNPDSNLNNAVGLASPGCPAEKRARAVRHRRHARQPGALAEAAVPAGPPPGLPARRGLRRWRRKIFFDQLDFVRRFFPDHPALNGRGAGGPGALGVPPRHPLHAETFWGHYLYGVLESAPAVVLRGARPLLHDGSRFPLDEESRAPPRRRCRAQRLFERLQGEDDG